MPVSPPELACAAGLVACVFAVLRLNPEAGEVAGWRRAAASVVAMLGLLVFAVGLAHFGGHLIGGGDYIP